MSRIAPAAALTALILAAAPASAENGKKAPDAARVRTAAEQFDAGMAASKAKDWETAASNFEAADAAVPSPQALRKAIRARVEAGQGSRAATLAALALERYAGDEATAKLAHETIDKFEPLLQKVNVSCASPCVLAVGTRSIPGESNTRWVLYLDPGSVTLSASFLGGLGSAPRTIDGKAGRSANLRFEPVDDGAASGPKPRAGEAGAAGAQKASPKQDLPPDPPPPVKDEPKSKGISPAFFAVSLVATAGLGGTTIWSGIDTINNPGADAVKKACGGKGPECPLYKEGLSHQLRTNVLIGATAGTAALTLVFAIFTNWRGNKPKPPAEPTAIVVDRGAALGARGAF
jgi:hypothetical protein